MSYVGISEKPTTSIFGAEVSGVMILLDMRTVLDKPKSAWREGRIRLLGGSVENL